MDKRYGRIINSTGILNYIRKWGEYTMSAQTDCEMLAIRALENYATQHHIAGEMAADIFHKNQVFEKMLIQHEYLHQISINEVDEFVEKIISDASTELVVYHGRCYEFDEIHLRK